MRYLSVCAGIEAATVAWHHMGWEAAAYSEIEKFPSAVLKHHYPDVPHVGDMTKYKEWDIGTIDLLVGGTPCQSFSVAGLRKGMADPRGNLALVYCGILDHFRPRWFVWENVPGVLSSNGGRDFGSFLGALAQLGYGFAYRVLDAQFFGVAQRRRRVFVVGYLGDWRRAAAVLFERNSLCRNSPPSREARKVTPTLSASGTGVSRVGFNCEDEWFVPTTASCLETTCNDYSRADGFNMVSQPIPIDTMNHIGRGDSHSFGGFEPGAPSYTLTKGHSHAVAQPIPYDLYQITAPVNSQNRKPGDPCHTLARDNAAHASVVQAIPFDSYNNSVTGDVFKTLDTGQDYHHVPNVMQSMAVRRLTPVECERLQGFPDNYTNIKENCPDGPRYKALGNSMAVPVMRWIGKRIQEVDCVPQQEAA